MVAVTLLFKMLDIMIIRTLFNKGSRVPLRGKVNEAVTTHAIDIGGITLFLWGFEEREKLM